MKHTKVITILIIVIFLPLSSYGNTCQGRFVNPITDICWSCLLPISIGGFNIGKGSSPKKRDTKNPSSPLCLCTKGNVPIPGIAIGFWEPVRLVDITRTPYCMVNLGGLSLGTDLRKVSSYARGYGDHHAHHSFYHVHYYIYPLIYWLELITDFICLEQSRCLVPGCNGVYYKELPSREELWDKYYTAVPKRQRQYVSQSKIVKRA
ncbi:TraU family protein [Candidatus Tisiphia endosymbiont of Dioctria rufipes]|uniref:TraU family protein n=1 Tax=Candidatus Tisiphia endosymbiont of Dioctria rufipes TaxID=3066255 RepID=UPI00312C8708